MNECRHPRVGVVTTLGIRESGESFAWAPVCARDECITAAMDWVRRISRRAAYHVLDGAES